MIFWTSSTVFTRTLLSLTNTKPAGTPARRNLPVPGSVILTPARSPKLRFSSAVSGSKRAPKLDTAVMSSFFTKSVLPSRLRKVNSKSRDFPSRSTVTVSLSPGRLAPTTSSSSFIRVTVLLPARTTTSPRCKPAFSAAPPATTSVKKAPCVTFRFISLVNSGVRSDSVTPKYARCTIPYRVRSSTTLLTILTGTANEYPS